MTLCIAWTRQYNDTNQLVFATDSLITGGYSYPHGTKLVVFTRRRGCALCWEGETAFTYSFAENARVDVEYSDGLASEHVPLYAVARRVTKIFNQLWETSLADPHSMFHDAEFSFFIGGFCTRYRELQMWHIYRKDNVFTYSRRTPSATKPCLIGSGASYARQMLRQSPDLTPYQVLCKAIEDTIITDVGGMPQLVTVDDTGHVEIIGFERDGERFLFGRPLKSSGHQQNVRYIPYNNTEF